MKKTDFRYEFINESSIIVYKNKIDRFKIMFEEKAIRPFDDLKDLEQEVKSIKEDILSNLKVVEGDWDAQRVMLDEADSIGEYYYAENEYMREETISMWITRLYHNWEQQVRLCLYYFSNSNEELKSFCSRGYGDIRDFIESFNVDIAQFETWKKLNELRLINNIIKHGPGKSYDSLMKINKSYFEKEKYMLIVPWDVDHCYEDLIINEKLFYKFCDVIIDFWEELHVNLYDNR